MRAAIAVAAIGCLLGVGGALWSGAPVASRARAQSSDMPATDATARSAQKPMAAESTIAVTVTNSRPTGLIELDAAPAGSSAVRKIVENLGPGRRTIVRLPRGVDCAFDLRGIYQDGATATALAVDLCKEGKVNLVE